MYGFMEQYGKLSLLPLIWTTGESFAWLFGMGTSLNSGVSGLFKVLPF